MPEKPDEWTWTVGQVVGVFGRVGELKVRIETDFPERFATLKRVCLRLPAVPAHLFPVQRARPHKGQILLKLDGIERIEEAGAWRGALVQIPRNEAAALPEGSYYSADLVGLEVVTIDGRIVGKVDQVLRYPAQDLLKVGEALIPTVAQIVKEVDIPAGKIVVDPPEGMLPESVS